MEFEWNETKNRTNIEKHGILFREATEIFGRPIVRRTDKRFNYNETRYVLIGSTAEGIILTVVCTIRNNKIRIISARISEKKERAKYYDHHKIQN